MSSHVASYGRGGAGNMGKSSLSPTLSPADLETPTLKKPIVTTGRGGNGNMAKNDDPAVTRQRQDVLPVPRRASSSAQYAGRGGAGNVFKGEDLDLTRVGSTENAIDDSTESSSLKTKSKGKSWLFGKKP